MKKIRKGQYGYRDQHKKSRLLMTGLFVAAIIAQLVARGPGCKKYPDCYGNPDGTANGESGVPAFSILEIPHGRSGLL